MGIGSVGREGVIEGIEGSSGFVGRRGGGGLDGFT